MPLFLLETAEPRHWISGYLVSQPSGAALVHLYCLCVYHVEKGSGIGQVGNEEKEGGESLHSEVDAQALDLWYCGKRRSWGSFSSTASAASGSCPSQSLLRLYCFLLKQFPVSFIKIT